MNLTITFGLTTLALAGAVWHCYKSNKPLREEARKAREETERKAFEDAKRTAEAIQEAKAVEDHLDHLEGILSGRIVDKVNDKRTLNARMSYSHKTRMERKYPAISHLLSVTKLNTTQEVFNLNQRVSTQSKMIRDLTLQLKDVQKALQLGQPVE
ncbi:hypothetical protein phiIBB-PF7Ap10 [Pseudomonas phage phiIBB-PF7A]|uniref:Uncharacterized protein n=1 Tax=Pseudomonas phage phiIBB-PF7A TaxID=942165 RepID=E9KIE6_9CAUD|nr:DNA ligase [Pseudomonas phage phiIBB-PF7A]ADV35671.1 hypothetical protein phiIBB-PF7Ap10 [Pseudomonas phage phiIBB-PF7A]